MKTKQEVLAANRARSYNWRADRNYQMSELNPDPKMRPSIDALSHKLRNISVLKGKPEAAAFIIHDLMYQHLYSAGPHPSQLWEIMVRANNLWQMSLGIAGRLEVDRASLVQADQPVPQVVEHQLGLRIIDNKNIWHCACGYEGFTPEQYAQHRRDNIKEQTWQEDTNTNQTVTQTTEIDLTTSGGASSAIEKSSGSGIIDNPVEVTGGSATGSAISEGAAEASSQDFPPFHQVLVTKLKKERNEITNLIWDHRPKSGRMGMVDCDCGREYGDYDAWANHVRIRIERYLLNEFASDATGG